MFAAGYFAASGFVFSFVLVLVNFVVHVPSGLLLQFVPPAMTLAFLLVLTGFQHFDGLVDLGNAVGLKRVEDRREIAHRWVVTYRGALLAIFVEFSAFAGLFLLNWSFALRGLIVAEVAAKLAMVTITWHGKPAHVGLGARFLGQAKRNLNVLAYVFSFVIGFAFLGLAGLLVIGATVLLGLLMEGVGNSVFGGVSGDMIGATNEATRAMTLVLIAGFSFLLPYTLAGALAL